jgi:hypothetical protein
MVWTVTYHDDIPHKHDGTFMLHKSVQVAADCTVMVSGHMNTSRWQCCVVTTATQGISGRWDPLPLWGYQLTSIGRLHRWWNGEHSLDIEGTGEIKYPGWTQKLTYDGLPRGNQDLGRSGNCKWKQVLQNRLRGGDEVIDKAIDQKSTGEDSSHCISCCTAMWKEKPPHYDLKASTKILWWIHLVLNFLEIK